MELLFYLSSAIFLGWSLGANDSANVFGTAVSSRMLRFSTAATTCALMVVAGAVYSGAGAAGGLEKLGAVNALAGSFTVSMAAAVTVGVMTRYGLPVSVTQAIVGALVGWNVFAGVPTDDVQLRRIASTWVACPLLGMAFAIVVYWLTAQVIRWLKPHMLYLDQWTRCGLWLAGAFGAYSLGANNIGNVVGAFLPSNPFRDFVVGQSWSISGSRQLLFIGGLSIAVGAVTYSRRVRETIGRSLIPLTPIAAWVVVVVHGLVLFLFSSESLNRTLASWGLPQIPLIPVSSSQAVIGAVLGIALVQGGGKAIRQFNWWMLAGVVAGWIVTPIVAGWLCYVSLFIVQNVFQEPVVVTP